MKRFAVLTLTAAVLTLAACSDNDAADRAATDTATTETVVVPAAEETTTTVVREVEADADRGDRVTIGEDGVTADVGDGDTRVRADVDDDPSLTVESD